MNLRYGARSVSVIWKLANPQHVSKPSQDHQDQLRYVRVRLPCKVYIDVSNSHQCFSDNNSGYPGNKRKCFSFIIKILCNWVAVAAGVDGMDDFLISNGTEEDSLISNNAWFLWREASST